MIPKIIHQIWLQGENQIPQNLLLFQNKIKELHSDWKYICWDETKIIHLLENTNKNWLDIYNQFDYLHQKVDYSKLIILYIYGGVFIDMDAYTIQKLDSLIDKVNSYDFVASYIKKFNFIINYILFQKFDNGLNNGNFLAKPNSNILLYLINHISTKCSPFDNKISCISKTTGPIFFNTNINNYLNDNTIQNKSKILLLENEYLEPCVYDICDVTPNTYIKHEHSGSWYNEYLKYIIIFYLKNTTFTIIIILLLIFLIIYLIYNHFSKKIKNSFYSIFKGVNHIQI